MTDQMKKGQPTYDAYVRILHNELIPAMGCTEPIALAYAAALARQTLGSTPDKVEVGVSGSILKNIKSVIVPNTGHMKGIAAAVIAGTLAGDASRELEVIAEVSDEQCEQIRQGIDTIPVEVEHIDNGVTFDIILRACKGNSYSTVRIAGYHTNVVLMEKDGTVLSQREVPLDSADSYQDGELLNMEDIWEFANRVQLDELRALLNRQIECNMAIAREGLNGDYGANIGSVLLNTQGDSVRVRARAMAAAGSDARMNGCEMPVIINSGSGNQGITASVPVVVYAEELGSDREQLYRALILSNLIAIYQKSTIGRLSAYCGAVNAAVGAGAGIAYLHGGGYKEIVHTVVNALAIVSGIVCDGAKASCAAKIASAVDAGIFGYEMYICGQQFRAGDGIVSKGVERTIMNVGRLGKEGMRETNEEIIHMMLGDGC